MPLVETKNSKKVTVAPNVAIVALEFLVSSGPDINEEEFPDVFSACTVMCAQSKSNVKVDTLEHNVTYPDVPWSGGGAVG